nr:MAG TPA: hypothetical protein [Caudoviricetes sp.]DAW80395.1 MAG TPA: hypothetical protein [Caudoviricetes sp.]
MIILYIISESYASKIFFQRTTNQTSVIVLHHVCRHVRNGFLSNWHNPQTVGFLIINRQELNLDMVDINS